MNLDLKHMNNMDQYISKAVVKAEIKRKLQDLIVCKRDTSFVEHRVVLSAKIDICKEILSFLDTLETKEVNFEKEFDNYANGILACDVQFEPFTHLHKCAKYFFELGSRTHK